MRFTALDTWDSFREQAIAEGFDEVLERIWAPGQITATHSHPFDVEARVGRGEMWLTHGGRTLHLTCGSTFALDRDTPHAERYGPEGATVWAARRTPR